MGITVKNTIKKFKTDTSEYVIKKLSQLDSKCYLQRKQSDYKFNIHQKENKKLNLPTGDGKPCMRAYVYGNLMFAQDNVYLSNKCINNSDALEHESYRAIYETQYNKFMKQLESMDNEEERQKFKEENMIINDEDDMKGIKITDENVDEIVNSILGNLLPFSPEYIKMFLEYR
ncbi:hypothetical protein AB8U03_06580 [Clostridium sp. Mt-5]|uniref:Uncharacterized protein n=1 Tax=Clostridium moutaii TaxID=3240932 RepID=A0ABV4BQ56_9CLOT